jgi:hypothetical protein
MPQPDILEILPITSWRGPFEASLKDRAVGALEGGKVVLLPAMPFRIDEDEADLLDPTVAGRARKNISYDHKTGALANTMLDPIGSTRMIGMMDRFGRAALRFVQELVPGYANEIERGRTSFRPVEIEGRVYSPRHDDKRLHVDAFPSRPLRGRRIMRVFSNVARDGSVRQWRVGEPFADFARKFMPKIGSPLPGSAWLLDAVGLTKGRRSAYDHFMLNLHDRAKMDSAYQANAPKADVQFPPGVTWLCFTDQVLHAALAGHGALEQTFYLPVEAMMTPDSSPLRVLESIAGDALV